MDKRSDIDGAVEHLSTALCLYDELNERGKAKDVPLSMFASKLIFLARGIAGGNKRPAGVVVVAAPRPPSSLAILRPGDRVIRFDGKDVHSANDLLALVRKGKADAIRKLIVQRGIERLALSVSGQQLGAYFLTEGKAFVDKRLVIYRGLEGTILKF